MARRRRNPYAGRGGGGSGQSGGGSPSAYGSRGTAQLGAGSPGGKSSYQGREPAMPSVTDEDLQRRMKIVGAVFPDLKGSPDQLLALVQQNIPDDELVQSAAKTSAWAGTKKQADSLRKLPKNQQRQAWKSMDKNMRASIKSFGYKPPPDQKDDDGGWLGALQEVGADVVESIPIVGAAKAASEGDFGMAAFRATPVGMFGQPVAKGLKYGTRGREAIGEAVDRGGEALGDVPVAGPVARGVGATARKTLALPGEASDWAVENVGHPALSFLDAVGDVPFHAYRTGQRLQEQAKGRGDKAYGGIGEALTDPLSVADAWSETEDPTTTFHTKNKKEAKELLGGDRKLTRLATGFASGKTIEDFLNDDSLGFGNKKDAYLTLSGIVSSPKFQKAVEKLTTGRVAPGMDAIGELGIAPDTAAGTAISTSVDLTISFIFDPILVAGKARKAWNVARWGLSGSDLTGGIKAAETVESGRLTKTFGEGWAEAAARGEISPAQMSRAGAQRSAFAQDIADAFRARHEWRGARAAGEEAQLAERGNPLYELLQRRNRLRPAIDDFIDYDAKLRTHKLNQATAEIVAKEGRVPAEAELSHIKGIESAADIWDFYKSTDGVSALVSGHWARPTAGMIELPRLSRKGMASAQAKVGMEKVINWAAGEAPAVDLPFEADDLVDGAQRLAKQADALPDAEAGTTRLYRVQSGPGLQGARDGVPQYVLDHPDKLGLAKAEGSWFTSDLERARAEAAQAGPNGRLYFTDVPDKVAEQAKFANNKFGGLATDPSTEFLLAEDQARTARLAGRIGDYTQHAGKVVAGPMRYLLAPPARLFRAMSQRIPEGHVIPLHGPDFAPELQRFVEMGLPGPAKARLSEELFAADNPALRRNLMRSVMDRVFWSNGVYETPEGRQVAETYLNGIKQQYAANGADIMVAGTEPMRAGILPVADHADGMAIPSFRDILAQSQRTSFTRTIFGGINNGMVDAFMGTYWKPAVLMRLGFVPRAAADEMLSAVLRTPELLNPVKPIARRIAAKEGEPTFLNHMVADVARGIQTHLPETAMEDHVPMLDRFAQFLDNRASGWVRGMANRIANPQDVEYARALGNQPAVQRAFTEEFYGMPGGRPGVGAYRSSWLDEDALGQDPTGLISIKVNPKNPDAEVKLATLGSDVTNYTGEDYAFHGMWNYQINRTVKDPVGRATAEALGVYVHPDQAAELDGHLNATRRSLAGTKGESFATDFLDDVADVPGRAVSKIRGSLSTAGPEVRGPLQRYYRMSGSDDPDMLASAGRALEDAKSAAYKTGDPALVMLTESAERLPSDLRWGLTVDPGNVLGRLRPKAAREAAGVPPVDEIALSAREQKWADLATQAEAGDWTAARDLAHDVALRELQNPEVARQVRESARSSMMRGGTPVAEPVADGMTRVYFPVMDGAAVGPVQEAMATGSSVGRHYMSQALSPGRQGAIARDLSQGVDTGLVPASRMATADFDEAVDLHQEITQALTHQPHANSALHYVDVPDTEMQAFRRASGIEGFEVGTHDYHLAEGQAYRGKPIDPSGPFERDGVTAMPGVTYERALEDWADTVVGHSTDLFTSPRNGRVLHEVATRGAQEGNHSMEWLVRGGPAAEDTPRQVLGPSLYYPSDNLWQKATRFGFDRVIGKGINALSREPLWLKYGAKRWQAAKDSLMPLLVDDEAVANAARIAERVGLDDINDLRRAWDLTPAQLQKATRWDSAEALAQLPPPLRGLGPDDIAQIRSWVSNQDYALGEAAQRAAEGAFRDMTPFVDDHRIKSQFSEYVRNVVPFWFAEEQFLKRLALTAAHSPEALRRAQLLMGAAKHYGFVRQNQYGEDVFVYPGSAQLQSLMAGAAEKVFGEPYTLPIEVPLTGQVQFATPGFNRIGVPGYSPVVAIPLTLLKRRFPELTSTVDESLGSGGQGGGGSIVSQLIPASVMRFYQAVTGSSDRDAQFGSAVIQAMQLMEANHLTPAEDAPPGEWAKYNDRIENWTRILLVNRAIFGFVGPASPQSEFPGANLTQEFRQMLKTLPIEEASSEFLRLHPDATPYTVFTSKSTSGATLPTTREALDFMTHNDELIRAYPQASAWLLPQSDAKKPSERSAFAQQMQMGLRERKMPEEWQADFYFQRAADLYFKSKDRYEIARQAQPRSEVRNELDDRWRQWKDGYFKQHPVFAEQLQSREAHNRRMKTLDQMKQMFNDDRLPDGVEHAPQLREMVQSWRRYDSAIKQMTGDRRAGAQDDRKQMRVAFSQWGRAYVRRHPKLKSFWQRVIEREIGLDAGDITEGM